MNYELAKQLKDAGFPNIREIISKDIDVKMVNLEVVGQFEKENIIGYEMPTLSELIEACGDDFVAVGREHGGEWRASTIKYSGFGNSPEESVANLWLELNKK